MLENLRKENGNDTALEYFEENIKEENVLADLKEETKFEKEVAEKYSTFELVINENTSSTILDEIFKTAEDETILEFIAMNPNTSLETLKELSECDYGNVQYFVNKNETFINYLTKGYEEDCSLENELEYTQQLNNDDESHYAKLITESNISNNIKTTKDENPFID